MNQLFNQQTQGAMPAFIENRMTLNESMQMQLSQDRDAMQYVTQLMMAAGDEYSRVFNYNTYRTMATLAEVAFLKSVVAARGDLTPMVEAHLDEVTQQYLSTMAMLPQHAMLRISEYLNEVEIEPRHLSFIEELKALIKRHWNK